MKPLNKEERWYIYLWLLHDLRRTNNIKEEFPGSIVEAAKPIRRNVNRHTELQRYSNYLVKETAKIETIR